MRSYGAVEPRVPGVARPLISTADQRPSAELQIPELLLQAATHGECRLPTFVGRTWAPDDSDPL